MEQAPRPGVNGDQVIGSTEYPGATQIAKNTMATIQRTSKCRSSFRNLMASAILLEGAIAVA